MVLKVLTDKRGKVLKTVPKFWLHAFTAHPIIVNLLNNKDHEIFDEYLSSIEVEDNQDVSTAYSITFNFNDNAYFDNQSIAKSIIFI
ncbi:putative nucleosome assembly protein (NAP) [Medicago truncatula]|uniref:Nucleosome/chromatin assembly factor group protein n=1 Tax=Medicago truncatula TaxID=3880 RepID=A0A072TRX5_MEDTR|nr:nucleosome/chromatin assembly factor group protein [Medicago truncatula]RHN53092.1 putative nucleosome assembly protein (NAP) [Medicago truncatula]RHN53106.1 putative nucleosome assembly protein (NAP) [Medicago truncatula]